MAVESLVSVLTIIWSERLQLWSLSWLGFHSNTVTWSLGTRSITGWWSRPALTCRITVPPLLTGHWGHWVQRYRRAPLLKNNIVSGQLQYGSALLWRCFDPQQMGPASRAGNPPGIPTVQKKIYRKYDNTCSIFTARRCGYLNNSSKAII